MTSLPDDFQINYDGEIAAFWQQQVAQLPRGARILDVCTGNGAVALLLAQASAAAGTGSSITAIDAAEIRPDLIKRRFPQLAMLIKRIRFIGARRFETLAVTPASLDLITSQYGIEYCEPAPAARKCFELLKPGGRLALICHAPDSAMIETMQTELAGYRRIDETGLIELFRGRFSGTLNATVFRDRLSQLRDQLSASGPLAQLPLLQYAIALIGRALLISDRQLELERSAAMQAVEQLLDGRERLRQMLEVNQRLHDSDDWSEVFVEAGLRRLDRGALRYRGTHPVGTWYRFERPATEG